MVLIPLGWTGEMGTTGQLGGSSTPRQVRHTPHAHVFFWGERPSVYRSMADSQVKAGGLNPMNKREGCSNRSMDIGN
tara:strand:+ start:73 stop:303 length:231 start_codon:yes stop_codon:yes gene_type:complete